MFSRADWKTRQLVNFVRRVEFDMSLVDGVVGWKMRKNTGRKTSDERQRFSPKSSKSIFAAGKLGTQDPEFKK